MSELEAASDMTDPDLATHAAPISESSSSSCRPARTSSRSPGWSSPRLVSTEPDVHDERLDDLRLAVSEACTNAIEAQSRAVARAVPDAPITVRCWVEDGRAEVEIHDNGPGFDPGSLAPHPPVTDPARLDFEARSRDPAHSPAQRQGRVPTESVGHDGGDDVRSASIESRS